MRRRSHRTLCVLILVAVTAAAGCADPPSARVEPLRVLLTGEIDLPEGLTATFAERAGVNVVASREDGAVRSLEALMVSPDEPVADVVIGIPDVVLLDTADAPIDVDLPAEIMLPVGEVPPRPGLAPLTILDLCLVWDRDALQAITLTPPSGVDVLSQPEWFGKFVVPDPSSSLEGRLFLESLRARMGDDPVTGWLPAAAALVANGLVTAPTWREAFDRVFISAGNPEGPPVVWAGAAIAAVAVRLVEPIPSTTPLGVTGNDSCIRSVIGAVVPANAVRPRLAEQFIAALQREDVQNLLLDDRGGLPVAATSLPAVYSRFATRPPAPQVVHAPAPDAPSVVALWEALVVEPPAVTG